jgi:hypothetical protein
MPEAATLRPLSALTLMLTLSCAATAAPYFGTVIANGLNNPRDVAIAPDGSLYIAEAGVPAGSGSSTEPPAYALMMLGLLIPAIVKRRIASRR